VKSRSTILRYLEEVIDGAEFELALSLTPDLLTRFEAELRDAIETGVSVDLIVTPASEAPDPAEFAYGEVVSTARARRGITTPVVAVADGSLFGLRDARRSGCGTIRIATASSSTGQRWASLVSAFFGTVLWTTTDQTLGEDDTARSYPRKYAPIRRCVKDLLDEGGEFYATVDGRDVEVGGKRIVRGRVRDISF